MGRTPKLFLFLFSIENKRIILIESYVKCYCWYSAKQLRFPRACAEL